MTLQEANLANGVTLSYLEKGHADGTPVLLIPGLGDSCLSYEPVLHHMPDVLRTMAISQRGHGQSSHAADGYAIARFVEDIDAFMHSFELGPAILVGHSSHGVVVTRLGTQHPHRVLGLVLIDVPISLKGNEAAQRIYETTLSQLSDPVGRDFARSFNDEVAGTVSADFMNTIIEETSTMPARVFRDLFGELLETDLSDELPQVRAPALLIWGDEDAILSRAEQEGLADALPKSRLIVYEGSGHSPHWEEPERFASDVAAFAIKLGSDV